MTQPAARTGDVCTGHGSYPSRKSITGSPNTQVNNIPAHRRGDAWQTHCSGSNCHPGVTIGGSSSVYINNQPAARTGDPVNCGSKIASGSQNVFVG